MIDSLTMPTLKGRSWCYGATATYYLFSLVLLWDKQLPDVTYALFIGLVVVLSLLTIISLFFKMSAHLTAMGGVLGAICWLGFQFDLWDVRLLMVMVFLSGLLATSRLYLQAHDEKEVASGFVLGFSVIFATLFIMIN